MPYTSAQFDDVFIVRWKTPVVEDVGVLVQEVKGARLKAGKPVHFLAIVPKDCGVPDEGVRASMKQSMAALLDNVVATHYVIEGEGFRHSILRSALTGILLVASKKDSSFVHGTTDEALVRIGLGPAHLRFVKEGALKAGLLTQA